MPKSASTDSPHHGRPSALEMFTDRVDERELLSECLAPYDASMPPKKEQFITVFYGVGGVGKSTLCRWAIAESKKNPSARHVRVAVANRGSSNHNPATTTASVNPAYTILDRSRLLDVDLSRSEVDRRKDRCMAKNTARKK